MAWTPGDNNVTGGAPANPSSGNVFSGIPSNIKVATDRQFNIWYDALLFHSRNLVITKSFTGPTQNENDRCFRVTPTSTGSHTLTLSAYNLDLSLIESKAITIDVVGKNAGSGTKTAYFIGDSLVAGCQISDEIKSLATAGGGAAINFVGSNNATSGATTSNEGWGGWTTVDFTTNTVTYGPYYRFQVSGVSVLPSKNDVYTNNSCNFTVMRHKISGGTGWIDLNKTSGTAPSASGTLTRTSGSGDASIAFSSVATTPANALWDTVNSRVDFQKYATNFGLATPDLLVIQLGINDFFPYSTLRSGAQVNAVVDNLKSIVNVMTSATTGYPSCKIVISLPPITGIARSGFDESRVSTTWNQAFEYNMRAYHRSIISTFDSGAYHANVSVCNTFHWVDRLYSYPNSSEARSSRDSNLVDVFQVNVHPDTAGSLQQADAIFSHLKSLV